MREKQEGGKVRERRKCERETMERRKCEREKRR